MPRLISISWREAPGMPGLRASGLQTLFVGREQWREWRVAVKGMAILLIAPAGWNPSETARETGRFMYELPRENASLRWAFDDGETPGPVKDWEQPEPARPPLAAAPAVPVSARVLEHDDGDIIVSTKRPGR